SLSAPVNLNELLHSGRVPVEEVDRAELERFLPSLTHAPADNGLVGFEVEHVPAGPLRATRCEVFCYLRGDPGVGLDKGDEVGKTEEGLADLFIELVWELGGQR